MLPFSGAGDGAIYFRDGTVVLARSTRTPGPSVSASTVSAGAFSPTPSIRPDSADGVDGAERARPRSPGWPRR